MDRAADAGKKFQGLVKILNTLRSEKGCPWDREQDEKSIASYFLEEVYEALEAINKNDTHALAEELGDVLMEVVFLAHLYKEKGHFTISGVLEGINQKMIRRHPHVFGKKRLTSSKKVLDEWNRQKKEEKERESLFNGRVKSLPSLLEAFQIGQKVSAYGFDWESALDALQKVREEVSELERALKAKRRMDIFQEMGDIFFSLANVSRLLDINPEMALKQTNEKFIKRFRFIENKLKKSGRDLTQTNLKEMDKIWEEAKEKIN